MRRLCRYVLAGALPRHDLRDMPRSRLLRRETPWRGLSKPELVEKLRGESGRYILHELGTYTLREADGSVISEVPRQFVDELRHAGGLVRHENEDPQKLFPAPAFG